MHNHKNHRIKWSVLGIYFIVTLLALASLSTAFAQGIETDLSLSKTVDDPTPADGGTVVFTLTASNLGPNDATGVVVIDPLPAGLTYLSDDGAGAYDPLAGIWTIGSLLTSASATLHITATVDFNTDGQTISNAATISATETDPVPDNNIALADIRVRVNDLCATTGTVSMPDGASFPFWGYAPGDCTSGASAQLPGPVVVFTQGEAATLTLHNNLTAEATGLHFPTQDGMPDLAGVMPGFSKVYSVDTSAPGSFLYEASPLANAQHQVALGMYGALIVRPAGAPQQAFADPATAFDLETVVVLSEIDPALHNHPTPAAFDMRDYSPRYWLINGRAYPQTDAILSPAGSRVLLRVLNPGQQPHTLALLGLYQEVISLNSLQLPYDRMLTSEVLSAGEAYDALVTVPASAQPGTRFALYEASMLLFNNGASGFGGMLTFLTIPGSSAGTDVIGPAASALALSPNPTEGSVDVTITGLVSDAGRGDAAIQAAEFFVDTPGASGTGLAMLPADGTFDTSTEGVVGTLTVADLAGLSSGFHAIYIHGLDSVAPTGNWGPFNVVFLNLDKTGPTTSAIALNPPVSQGASDVFIQATGNDTSTGGSNIVAAEYYIDLLTPPTPGTGTPLTVNQAAPIASLNGTIPAATMQGLSEGVHVLSIHSQDALGNWGDFATAGVYVDKTGPAASSVGVAPNPNNGTLGITPNNPSVRVTVTLADPLSGINGGAQSNIQSAEGFIDVVGANGSGFPLTPSDGSFNSTVESAYAFIPLTTINALSQGAHNIYIHGRDASGNWGATASATLYIDKTLPTISGLSASPNPTAGSTSVTLTATATDPAGAAPASNIVRAEWFEGRDPGRGFGTPMSAADGSFNSPSEGLTVVINVSAFTLGNHTLYVRSQDAAGNWSAASSLTLVVQPPDFIFADGFESGTFSAWSGGTSGPVVVNAQSAMVGAYGMMATESGNTPGYVIDNSPTAETTYHARFYFNPHGTITGNTQQDIFTGRNEAGATVFRVQYRRTNTGGGTYQVRATVTRSGGTTNTPWFTIANNTAHSIEIDWASGTSASFRFYVDGVLRQTLTGLNTSAYRVDTVWLGPSAGLIAGASGTMYFDQFTSKRYTYIGP